MIPTTLTEWFALLGNKWTLPVLHELNTVDRRRFQEFKRAIPGVSQRMLAQTLRELTEAGLVERTVLSVSPPRVNYALTALGKTLPTPIKPFAAWSSKATHEATAAKLDRISCQPNDGSSP
jgi:DNA-binding HxlR family transcriptional regulator